MPEPALANCVGTWTSAEPCGSTCNVEQLQTLSITSEADPRGTQCTASDNLPTIGNSPVPLIGTSCDEDSLVCSDGATRREACATICPSSALLSYDNITGIHMTDAASALREVL